MSHFLHGSFGIIVSFLFLLGAGCSSSQMDNPMVPSQPAVSDQAPSLPAEPASTSAPIPTSTPTISKPSDVKPMVPVTGVPIEYKNLGGDPSSSKYGLFKIKILTDKKVSSVEIAFEGTDANGQTTRSSNYVWQNIVNGEQKPIEQGKIYTDRFLVGTGTVKTKSSVKFVNFEDGSSWSP